MKNISLKSLDRKFLENPISVEKECNDFLKTRKGLQYLLLKYPTSSLIDAIRMFKEQAYIAYTYSLENKQTI